MARPQAKWGARSGYWIPEFSLDEATRKQINENLLKKPTADFYNALEFVTARFIAWSRYAGTAIPSIGNIRGALSELEVRTRELMERIERLDPLTGSMIGQVAALQGENPAIIHDSPDALRELWAAIRRAQYAISGKCPKGRPADPKGQYVLQVFEIFNEHGCDPKATRDGSFENCILILLAAAGEMVSGDSAHKLTLTAAKAYRVNKGTKKAPLITL